MPSDVAPPPSSPGRPSTLPRACAAGAPSAHGASRRWLRRPRAPTLRTTAADPEVVRVALADDRMGPPVSVRDTDDLHNALEIMIASAMRELLVVDEVGKVLGVLDQTEITIAYLAATARRT